MLLMVEKAIRGVIYHSIYRYAKDNNKIMKNYDKNKESVISSILISMVGQCRKSFQQMTLGESKIPLNLIKIS